MTTWPRGLIVAGTALVLFGCSPGTGDSETRTPAADTQESSTPDAQQDQGQEENAALDTFVAQQQSSIPAILETSPGTYSDASIEAIQPGTVEFGYVYAQQMDPAASASAFETMIPTLQDVCDTQVFPAMQAAGITEPSVVYMYTNPDGSEVWSHTFTMS